MSHPGHAIALIIPDGEIRPPDAATGRAPVPGYESSNIISQMDASTLDCKLGFFGPLDAFMPAIRLSARFH